MARLLRISVFVSMLLTVATTTWALDYKAVILHPVGFDRSLAYGISGGQVVGEIDGHGVIWLGTNESWLDLHPSGFFSSVASHVSGGRQVGFGWRPETGDGNHALLWSGTADSVVDLHPGGFDWTMAFCVSGSQQVGHGSGSRTNGEWHALLWTGTAESVVDLHPTGFARSEGWGVSGGKQVGNGYGPATGGASHALLWSGTSDSVIDLHPSGFVASGAWGISGDQQVGDVDGRAATWSGTPQSYVDIHPDGFDWSQAVRVSNGRQVGGGYSGATNGNYHALLWSGTSYSVVDLHSYLPVGYFDSYATAIDSSGTVVGYASKWGIGTHAIMWVPLIYVEIDIKPGSYPNSINLGNEGVIPVAILSSTEFDATTVDPATVELAGAGVELRGKSNKAMAHEEDVNKDGRMDLIVQITTQNLDPGAFQDGYATLTGKTYAGLSIEGADEIIIVPK